MRWIRELIDRWRRGPGLRELAATNERATAAAEEQRVALVTRIRELERGIVERDTRLHLLGELVRHTKARCHKCGEVSWKWEAVAVAGPSGRPTMQVICESCDRMMKREAKRVAEAAEAEKASA